MEEQKGYYLLEHRLKTKFNKQEWDIIRMESSKTFLRKQEIIMSKLLGNQNLYEKYFQIFYENHLTLANWCMLAVKDKQEIEKYLFRRLLNQKITFYNQKLKEAFEEKKKNLPTVSYPNDNGVSPKKLTDLQDTVYSNFFNDIKNRADSSEIQPPPTKRGEGLESYQFYIKTFKACQGKRYIFYDYEKHMKGLSEVYKYNQYIKSHLKNGSMFRKEESAMLHFEEFQKARHRNNRCTMLPVKAVLQDRQISHESGMKKFLKKNKSDKLVFVNHLGKPITYHIRRYNKSMLSERTTAQNVSTVR